MSYTPSYQTELDELERDGAENDMDRILQCKENLIELFNGMRNMIAFDASMKATVEEIQYAEACAMEAFDELWHGDWHRLSDISKSAAYTREIPGTEYFKVKIAKGQRDKKAARMSSNNQGIGRFRANSEAHRLNESGAV